MAPSPNDWNGTDRGDWGGLVDVRHQCCLATAVAGWRVAVWDRATLRSATGAWHIWKTRPTNRLKPNDAPSHN